MDNLLFQWDVIEAMVGGASALDLPRLRLDDAAQAAQFLLSYGFDVGVPRHRQELEWIRMVSLGFIERELVYGRPALAIPEELRLLVDVPTLLLWASGPLSDVRQRWACALLRVMHAVAHARLQLQERFGDHVREQILARFQPHLLEDDGALFLGTGPDRIPLSRFEVKHQKPLDSVILKLLHKPENVATDIFDHLGLRFVTVDRLDVLLVVRYLRAHHVVSFPNIKPSRSKNTLLDMEFVRAEVQDLLASGRDPEECAELLRVRVESSAYPNATVLMNPHSDVGYHAIQFTCRHYVRVADPLSAPSSGRELSFFFPYEVQITDRASFEATRSGLASHEEYRRRQRDIVRHRVLGPVMTFLGETFENPHHTPTSPTPSMDDI